MKPVFLRPQAEMDLDEIWLFIARHDPDAADKYVDALGERMLLLAEHPGIGKTCDHLAPDLRRFPFDDYVVFYTDSEDAIVIERILHGARDIENLLD